MKLRQGVAAVLAAGAWMAGASPAAALPGPPLQAPRAALDAAFGCAPGFAAARGTPILLLHGGNGSAGQWIGNYRKVLPEAGHPTCWVDVPQRGLGDVQTSVEYVVDGIRRMNARAGRKIAVIGHSEGGLLGSYALRFWPDLADRVDDFVGLSGVYAGGTAAAPLICAAACPVAARQISPGARFLAAYARHPLYRGPAYTTVATRFDELVTPQPKAGFLPGARNFMIQDLCPGRFVDHVTVVLDRVPYLLALDAITHRGPADPARIAGLCEPGNMPGADPAGIFPEVVQFAIGLRLFVSGNARAEPRLRCYLDPVCRKARLQPALELTTRARRRTRIRLTTTGRLVQPPGAVERCSGSVVLRVTGRRRTLSRRRVAVRPDCGFTLRQRARRRRGEVVRLAARFTGSEELLPVALPSRRVRLR